MQGMLLRLRALAFKATLLLVCWLFPFVPTGESHPFYVSVTEIQLREGRMELSVRLFTDDLEAALDAFGQEAGNDLIRHQPATRIDSLLPAYLTQKLEVRVNRQKLAFTYVGYEIEMDACWLHLEAEVQPKPTALQVDVQLLYELFPAQQNIVHLMQGSARKSTRLQKGDQPWEVQLPL